MKKRIMSLVLALVMCMVFSQLDIATAAEQDFLDVPPIDESLLELIEGSPYEQRVASEHIFWIEHDGSTGITKVVGEYRAEDDDNGELESPPFNPEDTAEPPKILSPIAANDMDGEKEITTTTEFPYSAIVYIVAEFEKGGKTLTLRGTGAMVGQSEVLTAGHMVYQKNYGYATSFSVTPGGPNSGRPTYTTNHSKTNSNWISNSLTSYDYALILLDNNKPNVGYYGIRRPSSSDLTNVTEYGFPGNKRFGTMWSLSGSVFYTDPLVFMSYGKSSEGYSGGPVVKSDDNRYIVGVSSGGGVANDGKDYFLSVRMSDHLYNFIVDNKTY